MRRRDGRSPSPAPSNRRGVSIVEFLSAAVMLVAVMGALFPLLARLGAARETVQGRESAVRELGNLLEIARSDGQVTQGELERTGAALVKERLAMLDDVRFAVRPDAESSSESPLGAVRPLVLTITWSAGKGRPQKVELTCWVPLEEGTP